VLQSLIHLCFIICQDNDRKDDQQNIIPNKKMRKHVEDDNADVETFEVEALPQPAPPPVGNKDERVLCIDLHRKCGEHDTAIRADQKRALHGVILESTRCADVAEANDIVERIFRFLDDDTHMYEDQYLCETSLFMAALLGCNTNVSVLGGHVQALNALFYLVGYLSKNPVTPNAWRTCVAAALQSARKNESVAEDKGSASRNAKFVLQKVLNYLNAYAEVSDTQLSMLLLGYNSYKSSHRFSFCFPAPALEAQAALTKNSSDTDVLSAVQGDGGVEDAKDVQSQGRKTHDFVTNNSSNVDAGVVVQHEEDVDDAQDVDSEDCDSDEHEDSNNIPNKPSRGNIIFRTEDNTAVALSQHDLYRYRVRNWDAELHGSEGMPDLAWWCVSARGCNNPAWRRYQQEKGLHDFNLMEYVRHIEVVEMPGKIPTTGPCQYYFFADDCPIKDSHIQKLHPKHRIAAVSGKPPRAPGERPQRKRKESERKFKKRMLTWRLQADLYGSTMGAILVPWDRHGDCNVHTYEDFECILEQWERNVDMLCSDREWRDWIFRDREVHGMDSYPDPSLFPDPRCAARLSLARNLGVNLRVSQTMRKITNRWRYQHADRFEDCDEYHECHGGDGTETSKLDSDNALAIAALIETMKRKKSDISGLDDETAKHIRELTRQVSCLFPGRTDDKDFVADPVRMPKHVSSRLDRDWYTKDRATDTEWAKKTLCELLKRKPPSDPKSDDNSCDNLQYDHENDVDLMQGLSDDQSDAFQHAVGCFDNHEPLRMFVHGGPGTGKSFLAERIMTAAKRRGLVCRFTALSGAAATVNDGTTIHYIAGLKKFCSWGRAPDANCVKQIHERSRGTSVTFIVVAIDTCRVTREEL